MNRIIIRCLTAGALSASAAFATHGPKFGVHPGYKVVTIRPASFQPRVGGMEFLPNGDLLVLTWKGGPGGAKVYKLTGVKADNAPAGVTVTEVATGFNDPLGMVLVDGSVYIGDIDKVTKLIDKDGDGKYEAQAEVGKFPWYKGWFEYSFGPVYKDGKFYMGLAAAVQHTGSPTKQAGLGRGSVVSVPLAGGAHEVVSEGYRAPDGIGLGPEDEIFVADNQGGWRPASEIIQVQKGKFHGYMVDPPGPIQTATNAVKTHPALYLNYPDPCESPTEPQLMKVGQFKGQLIFGDVAAGGVYRAFLEKVNGLYQGAYFPLSAGLEVGMHRMRIDDQGVIYMGGIGKGSHSNQGWNETTHGLQKLVPTGGKAFEMLAVRSKPKGFEIEFTMPVAADAGTPAKYTLKQWIYKPSAAYGGTPQETQNLSVKTATVSADKMKVTLEVDGLAAGKVVLIQLGDVKSEDGKTLFYSKTHYTLNSISDGTTDLGDIAKTEADLRIVRLSGGGLGVTVPAGTSMLELVDLKGALVHAIHAPPGWVSLQGSGFRGIHVLRLKTLRGWVSKRILL